jgi:hypothetical protein
LFIYINKDLRDGLSNRKTMSTVLYTPLRTLCTAIITSFGYTDVVKDPKLIQAFIGIYSIADTGVLYLLNKLETDILIHHGLLTLSALLCVEDISGSEDSAHCRNVIKKLAANETMGLLSSLNTLTHRRFQRSFDFLHIINIIIFRRRIWMECDQKDCKEIKSDTIRMLTKSMTKFMLIMDLYWSILIVRKYF